MDIVTKAKKSYTAYHKPVSSRPGRGWPPKKGADVHLKGLFASHAGQFRETEAELYGKKGKIRYYCIDLLWGQKLYQELRFVPGNEWDPKHSGEHLLGIGPTVHYTALQLPFPDRMYVP